MELSRITSVIGMDRQEVDDTFFDLFQNDFSKVIQDFFELKEHPIIKVEHSDAINVIISFKAIKIKNFNKII